MFHLDGIQNFGGTYFFHSQATTSLFAGVILGLLHAASNICFLNYLRTLLYTPLL